MNAVRRREVLKFSNNASMKIKQGRFILLCVLLIFFLTSCFDWFRKKITPSNVLEKITWSDIKLSGSFEEKERVSLIEAIKTNILWLSDHPKKRLRFGERVLYAEELIPSYEALFNQISSHDLSDSSGLKDYLEKHFDLYRARTHDDNYVRYTGYYLPEIEGSLKKSKKFSIPVYGAPKDLVSLNLKHFDKKLPNRLLRGRVNDGKFIPYWSRQDISSKRQIEGQKIEIAWVRSLVDIFFVEIQGSGLIRLEDGSKLLIGYEQENGHPYKAIGALLIQENHVPREEISMQRIKQWLAENPKHVDRVLNFNPSFVFFKVNPEGPLGNINITLTPRRSLAADQRFYPPGALTIVDLPLPQVNEKGEIEASHDRIQNLAFINDTGGAIKGSGRIDIYWGAGKDAEYFAGITNHMGEIYVLLPREERSLSSL